LDLAEQPSATDDDDNTMSQPGAEGCILPLVPFHFTLV
jgi:hypothetical protein